MLFPYTYVHHQLAQMQRFINFIFYEVWCRAPKTKRTGFSLDLFNDNPALRTVMHAFYFSEPQPAGAKFFYDHVEAIYQRFSGLTRRQISQIKRWHQGNNNIEMVCANDPSAQIVRYEDLPPEHQDLATQLAMFFKGLYSKDLLELKALRDKIGTIDDHYDAFMGKNKVGKCPFCGINDLKGPYHSKREAYDHYLPKAIYPFNSINFHNLVPACHECNSSYKTSKDPAFTPKDPAGATHRRKIFYPFARPGYRIDIAINLLKPDVGHLAPEDIQLTFGPAAIADEIGTWKDVYGIEERYKAKCCTESDGKYWFAQVLDEWKEDGRAPADFLTTLKRQTNKSPFASDNFLKTAFLEGCDQAGLFTP